MPIALTPVDILEAVRSGGALAVLGLDGPELGPVRVNDAMQLEIRNFPSGCREWLKSLGCFIEVIAYKTRLFMPAEQGEAILRRIAQTGD